MCETFARFAINFFEPQDPNNVGPIQDGLTELMRWDPAAATVFLKTSIKLGSVGSMIATSCCMTFFLLHWSQCGSCNRPLRLWLLVHSLLQCLQLPIRLVFYTKLTNAEAAGCVEHCVSSYASSPAWRLSLRISMLTYTWLILGVIWTLNVGNCGSCQVMVYLTAAIIALDFIRMFFVYCMCRRLFVQGAFGADADDGVPRRRGADPEMVRALPVFTCKRSCHSESQETCAVCLGEYVEGELGRCLPCNHRFHQPCIDRWLEQSKLCPLCMVAIDDQHVRVNCKTTVW